MTRCIVRPCGKKIGDACQSELHQVLGKDDLAREIFLRFVDVPPIVIIGSDCRPEMRHHDVLDARLCRHLADILRCEVLLMHVPDEAFLFRGALRLPDAVPLKDLDYVIRISHFRNENIGTFASSVMASEGPVSPVKKTTRPGVSKR